MRIVQQKKKIMSSSSSYIQWLLTLEGVELAFVLIGTLFLIFVILGAMSDLLEWFMDYMRNKRDGIDKIK